jgi:hypothetical protein
LSSLQAFPNQINLEDLQLSFPVWQFVMELSQNLVPLHHYLKISQDKTLIGLFMYQGPCEWPKYSHTLLVLFCIHLEWNFYLSLLGLVVLVHSISVSLLS